MQNFRAVLLSGAMAIFGWSIVMPTPATAQINASSNNAGAQIYEPAYFASVNPNTAFDMVARLPGFILQGGEGSERGFGQASLNILINGLRPSSKSSDARDILRRIPADTVIRIEIIDGASLDIPGLSGQVANIIASSGSLSGSWEYAARFEEGTEPQALEGTLNLSGKKGNVDFVLGLRADTFTFTEGGPEQFFDGQGRLIQDRTEDASFQQQVPSVNLNLTLQRDNGDVGNLNLSGSLFNRKTEIVETFDILDPDAGNAVIASGESVGDGGEDEVQYEISGDYATDFNVRGTQGRLKLIGLYRYEDSDFPSVFQFNQFGAPVQTTRFERDDIEKEYIARGEYTWKDSTNKDWALSLEGALNTLDSDTFLQINDARPDCNISPTDPNCDSVSVEERRVQAALTQSWRLSDRINLQSSIGAEYSEIDVVSAVTPARSFFRPKGFVSASYVVSPTYTWRTKVERSVGQLNFGTFVSTVNLSDDFANSGNNNIVPDQRWTGEVELERQDDKVVSGTLRAFVSLIDDPIDRILFPDGSEGAGNLDSALIYGADLNLTWIMDSIGIPGMRLEAEASVSDSRIEDPVTGVDRLINDTQLWEYELELRHDIPNTPYAWTAEVEHGDRSRFFRLDNIFNTSFDFPESEITAIHKDLFGMQWTFGLQNLFNFTAKRQREIFSPNRNGELVQSEVFNRQRGRRFFIEITDTF